MENFLHSKRWYYALARIGLLVFLAWMTIRIFNPAIGAPIFSSQWSKTDFQKSSVEMSEIMSGGPPKDGIPAIDSPQFISIAAASEWLHKQEPVAAVAINGKARAYPLQILMFHEIANDELGGVPITVTFCPLCNSVVAFDRRVGDRVLDFGTTGMLRKSNLVMYDRQTESWWQQFTGEGIVGEYTDTLLKHLPASIISFEEFSDEYPQGQVMSRKTGHFRSYGSNPYRGYDRIGNRPFLLNEAVDRRLPAMERVLHVSIGGKNKLYPFSALKSQPLVNDNFQKTPVAVFTKAGNNFSALDNGDISKSKLVPAAIAYDRRVDDRVLDFELNNGQIRDRQTGSSWNLLGRATAGSMRGKKLNAIGTGVHFAFAWLAFSPESEIYKP